MTAMECYLSNNACPHWLPTTPSTCCHAGALTVPASLLSSSLLTTLSVYWRLEHYGRTCQLSSSSPWPFSIPIYLLPKHLVVGTPSNSAGRWRHFRPLCARLRTRRRFGSTYTLPCYTAYSARLATAGGIMWPHWRATKHARRLALYSRTWHLNTTSHTLPRTPPASQARASLLRCSLSPSWAVTHCTISLHTIHFLLGFSSTS